MSEEATKPVNAAPKKPGRPPVIKPKPVEKVNTGDTEAPLVDTKPVVTESVDSGKTCPDHPEAKAVSYGMCAACYKKLSKDKKRKLYLNARLHGRNAHSYPIELRRAWKREVALIDAGLWKRPLKANAKTKLAEALMG